MAKLQITLYIWENKEATIKSIQGEAGSRTVEATFADKSGAPIDLTGCTPRMIVDNGDNPPMNDGTIVDAAGGVADFTVTSDMLARPGDWPCEFALVGPSYPLLKANGLTLHVDASNTENAVGSQNQLASLWIALNKADTAAAQTEQAVASANKAIDDINTKNQEITTAENARVTAEQTRQTNESARQTAETARVDAEKARADAETARKSAESSRATAEEARVSAESARVTAENKRQTDTQTAISGANTAATGANDAAGKANTSKTACDTATDNATNAAALANKAAGTMYASLSIDPSTGELSMSTDANYTGANFGLNDNGELEVTT